MKIDLQKAYDMVNWEFLQEVLVGYGFPSDFVHIIMTCVTSTYFTVKVNGEGHGYFPGKRGLRQGDLISSLLFVLITEYLSRTLKSMSDLPDFKFHPMCTDLRLTHLVFADDLMIFCKGDLKSVTRVMEALNHFSSTSGLVANLEKSSIFIVGIKDDESAAILENTGFSIEVFLSADSKLLGKYCWIGLEFISCKGMYSKSFIVFIGNIGNAFRRRS
ncbi:uncharacterized protein LOC107876864 [Capsicum annuum]|uniref:uncharacterized protein LOC107876864 n=1 Tax=Capsicum annuum TaxID=4072 RepID=UPI001FB05653|nr:uncharacterized protein LOC107876864 [Capsicum annuum]